MQSFRDPFLLIDAVKIGDIQTVIKCVAAKVEIDSVNEEGWNALHFASQMWNTEIVALLLANNANPNYRLDNLQTPLMSATVTLLVPERDMTNIDPFHQTVKLLIAAGADITLKKDTNHTILYYASKYNIPSLVTILLAYDVPKPEFLDYQDNDGFTALHEA